MSTRTRLKITWGTTTSDLSSVVVGRTEGRGAELEDAFNLARMWFSGRTGARRKWMEIQQLGPEPPRQEPQDGMQDSSG